MSKYVYIAGPYSGGIVARNLRKAVGAAEQLMKAGYVPFVPHMNFFWDLLFPHDYEIWLDLDMEWVRRCDYLVRLPGKSPGADREAALARANNIEVFDSVQALISKHGEKKHG